MALIGTYDPQTGLCLHYPQPGEPPPPRILNGWKRPSPPESLFTFKAGDCVEFSPANFNQTVKFSGLNAGFKGRLQGWPGNYSIAGEKGTVLHLGCTWNDGQTVWLLFMGTEFLFRTTDGKVMASRGA